MDSTRLEAYVAERMADDKKYVQQLVHIGVRGLQFLDVRLTMARKDWMARERIIQGQGAVLEATEDLEMLLSDIRAGNVDVCDTRMGAAALTMWICGARKFMNDGLSPDIMWHPSVWQEEVDDIFFPVHWDRSGEFQTPVDLVAPDQDEIESAETGLDRYFT